MDKPPLKVCEFDIGDHVRLLPHADLWMRGIGNTVGTVTAIGWKWITVNFPTWGTYQFHINSGVLVKA